LTSSLSGATSSFSICAIIAFLEGPLGAEDIFFVVFLVETAG
jgi:hypothetical protein